MADNLGKRSVRGWLLGKMLSRVCDKKFLVWVKPYTPHPTPHTLSPRKTFSAYPNYTYP